MKAVFNSRLLQRLVDLLSTNYNAISQHVKSCSRDTIRRGLMRGDIRFDAFIEICNAYRLNIWCFFLPIDEMDQPQKNIQLSKARYRRMTFHPEAVDNYENMEDKMWCKDVAEWVSRQDGSVMTLPVMAGGELMSRSTDMSVEDSGSPEPDEEELSGDYRFNRQLLAALPACLGIDRSEIGISCGRASNVYTYAMRQGNILVRSLVDICNVYHVDILQFFAREEFIPMDIIIPEQDWKPIVFHPERLLDFCGFGKQEGVLRKLNYSKQRLYRNVDIVNSPMKATALADICNKLKLEPNYFFETPEHAANQRVARQLKGKIDAQQALIDRLNIEKRRLESQLRHAKAMKDV